MRFSMIVMAGVIVAAMAAHAAPQAPSQGGIDAKYAPDIARVETYLSGITTVVASFSQTSADGSVGAGKFFLKRPGKMRWQYEPPTPILLVSNGKTITYYDSSLDQLNYLPVDESLAAFIAQPTIKLDTDDILMERFEKKDGLIRTTVSRKAAPEEGTLTLVFNEKPLAISQMVIADGAGNATTVNFENAQTGVDLPEKLFTFEDPRGITKRRR